MKLHVSSTMLKEKLTESLTSVLPILVIVTVISFSVLPVPTDLMLSFLVAALMVIIGIGLFSLGADASMSPIGSHIGTAMTKTRSLPFILIMSFVLGFAVTVAEPDLMVLADTVSQIDSVVLICSVGAGVGLFLTISIIRILAAIRLRTLLIVCYAVVFALAFLTEDNFLGVAFDSGGVTTGPMTVPFILALGIGVANIRNDANAEADSFGLVALCSIGPVLMVLLLGFLLGSGGTAETTTVPAFADTAQMGREYLREIPGELKQMALSLLPIAAIFGMFQVLFLRLSRRHVIKILVGIVYTYVGLVLFLTGVNVGFSPLGYYMGQSLAGGIGRAVLVPLSMVFGWFIISAEPAVRVLEQQVEEVSAGAIPGKLIGRSLSVAVSCAMGLSMLRIVYGIPILYFLVPGYAAALVMAWLVPDPIYTAIAFDSGGVASGPMTATFMLQFMIGAASALGRDVMADAFGVVAMVAMVPLIAIQAVGIACARRGAGEPVPVYGDDEIIELFADA